MAQVTVTIAGKTYRMACDNGQEDHLLGLASRLDLLIDEMRRSFGEIGDQRLIVMGAISVLDQLYEAERRIKGLESEVEALRENRDRLIERQNEVERNQAARMLEAATAIDALADALDGAKDLD